jgi:hypothetical protein
MKTLQKEPKLIKQVYFGSLGLIILFRKILKHSTMHNVKKVVLAKYSDMEKIYKSCISKKML